LATEIIKYICDICGEEKDCQADANICEENHAKVHSYHPFYRQGCVEVKAYPEYIDVQFFGNTNGLYPRGYRYMKACELESRLFEL
jgi:hypothetical protein